SVSLLFFLSSRRRHTSFSRDWSSDVCSSDLVIRRWKFWLAAENASVALWLQYQQLCSQGAIATGRTETPRFFFDEMRETGSVGQIGRASCRGMVCRWVGGISVTERKKSSKEN